jgi:hypothetical protein
VVVTETPGPSASHISALSHTALPDWQFRRQSHDCCESHLLPWLISLGCGGTVSPCRSQQPLSSISSVSGNLRPLRTPPTASHIPDMCVTSPSGRDSPEHSRSITTRGHLATVVACSGCAGCHRRPWLLSRLRSRDSSSDKSRQQLWLPSHANAAAGIARRQPQW